MVFSESKPHKSGWFRNFLHEKKNKFHPKKRCACCCLAKTEERKKDQIILTNSSADTKEEEKLPVLNVNAYGDSKKVAKNGECPGKIFPLERRGCGFHMYFCIDSAGKPNLARNNRIKKVKNQTNITDDYLGINKVDSHCVSESESFTTIKTQQASNRSPSPKAKSASQVNSRVRELQLSDIHESSAKSLKESDLTKHLNHSEKNQEENVTGQGNSILRNWKTSSHTTLVNLALKEPTIFLPPPLSLPEKQIYQYHQESDFKNVAGPLKRVGSDECDEDAVFKEYEVLRQNKTNRRSTMKSRGGVSRYSMMSMRNKRQSYMANMVPEILSKLDSIEEKLSELEKVYEDRGKNITNIVGISCKSVKSALSMDLKCQEDKSDEKKRNSSTSNLEISSYRVHPVVIKSLGEQVYVKEPESVSVVKNIRSKQESKQLVYHNTQELDAHNIASKSFSKTTTDKSQPQKPPSKLGTQSKEISNRKDSNMWRKISEELKL